MNKRKKYLIGIDTETTNGFIDENGKLDLSNSLVYDIGYQIIDKKGKVYLSRSFVVAEIFLDEELMASAYFKDKIPQYWEDIRKGKRQLKTFLNIYYQFLRDRKKYNCSVCFAHNAYFDYNALNVTLRYLTGSKKRFFFPYSLELWDTLKMSRDIFGNRKGYTLFCDRNNYKTKHKTPQNRYTAEILYRYISGNNDFTESHTGLEDVKIESEILVECLKAKKKMRKTLFKKKEGFFFCVNRGPDKGMPLLNN